MTSRWRGPA